MNKYKHGNGHALRVIAAFKIFEALLLWTAGMAALGLLKSNWEHAVVRWLDGWSLHAGPQLTSQIASSVVDALGMTSVQRLALIAVGCFVYGSVFIVEAGGLWLHKRWAEYLTTVVTASLLPFEVLELMRTLSLSRILTLVINLLVLAYLAWNISTDHSKNGGVSIHRPTRS